MLGLTIAALVLVIALFIATAVMIFRLRDVTKSAASSSTWGSRPTWLRAIWILNLLNFFAFFFADLRLGGDAWNGYRHGTHYFLGAKGGFYIPVSREVWLYSHYHLLLVCILFFVAFLALAWHTTHTGDAKV